MTWRKRKKLSRLAKAHGLKHPFEYKCELIRQNYKHAIMDIDSELNNIKNDTLYPFRLVAVVIRLMYRYPQFKFKTNQPDHNTNTTAVFVHHGGHVIRVFIDMVLPPKDINCAYGVVS